MRTSFSQHSTFVRCSQHWYHNYVNKLEAPEIGASLYFGSAIDASIMSLLEGKPDWKQKFFDRWAIAVSNGKAIGIFDNPEVVYAHADFDQDILKPQDLVLMSSWITELKLDLTHGIDPIKVYKKISKIKKNPYKRTLPEEYKYFDRCSWLSLSRKGELLIEAFYTQFFPRIKKVLSTQKQASIKDEIKGDSIVGVIDMVVELDGYNKPVILDLKTASTPYDKEQLEISDQLTLYAAMKGQEYNTNLVGYVVLCKGITKDTIASCKVCGFQKNSQHRTCNNELNGIRCEGDWLEKKVPKPEVQVLIAEKNQFQIESLLNDIGTTLTLMKNSLIYKNTNYCSNWFGQRCVYFSLCHKNDGTGLNKKGEK